MYDFQNFRMERSAPRWVGYSRVITMVRLVRASRLSIGCFAAQKRGERDLRVSFPEFQNGSICLAMGRLQPCDYDGEVASGLQIVH